MPRAKSNGQENQEVNWIVTSEISTVISGYIKRCMRLTTTKRDVRASNLSSEDKEAKRKRCRCPKVSGEGKAALPEGEYSASARRSQAFG